ncbi:TonB-dependent receptor [Flavilitoribacter nigricans]|uniref:TonB-dependent receptor n=1 Tax=Flavilitoribacter nigricans (strain ATCC 23147 / DSM 23189 / NBRC 102662 / NCIMB 1420 / SS-2) TaxID=1122177 RepID=A0A2D0N4X0_FLAN2|nr:TonB-dependent receptor [Flavilitoribacter nigricans]PHN03544.1 TonB-dependent receptor [Flavilitoribacter nigricans DSM 23189 = NBRC 102662]
MHKLIPLYILLSCGSGLYGQSGSVRGQIFSGDQPLEFASVALLRTSWGSISDTAGYFLIEAVPYGEYQIEVSMLGFVSRRRSITIDAQNQDVTVDFQLEPSQLDLDEVVVSGTMKTVSRLDSPVPVEVYRDDFFKANPTPSVFESLQNVNGVRPQLNCNVCNTGDIHINGLEGPYTMVLIDGMPIVSGLSTVYGLTGIPQSLIERVEVVKGPASTLYGSEAVGGLINIITRNPGSAPQFSADIFGTSWGELNTDLGLRFGLGKKASSLLGVNYFNYQQPIDHNGDGFTDVTLQDRISVFNKWSIDRPQNRTFSFAGRYVYEDRWGGEMNWAKPYRGGDEVYGESIYTNRWEAFGIYQLPTTELINFQFSANGHDQNSVYGNTTYLAQQYIGFGQLSWHKELGLRHSFLLGTAFRYTYYDDDTPATAAFEPDGGDGNAPSVTYLPGIFVQDEIALHANHKLLLGLRYDHNSLHGGILSPRINYKWSSSDKKSTLRISAGNGYRVANVFTEDHAALTGARQVVFIGDLQPETSWNANINVVRKIFTRNNTIISLDATAFYTYFNNRIIADYETNPNQIIYANLDGHAISRGVSLNVDLAFPSGFNVVAGLTGMDVFAEENGVKTQQILTESYSGVWNINYTFPELDLKIDYTGNVYGPMRLPRLSDTDPRAAESPWWSIQNLQLTKSFGKNWEIYAGVKNLLNFTPPANSIARAFDPFDRGVTFDEQGQVVATANNPYALTFDPSYVFAPNQGIRGFLGFRYTVR